MVLKWCGGYLRLEVHQRKQDGQKTVMEMINVRKQPNQREEKREKPMWAPYPLLGLLDGGLSPEPLLVRVSTE